MPLCGSVFIHCSGHLISLIIWTFIHSDQSWVVFMNYFFDHFLIPFSLFSLSAETSKILNNLSSKKFYNSYLFLLSISLYYAFIVFWEGISLSFPFSISIEYLISVRIIRICTFWFSDYYVS